MASLVSNIITGNFSMEDDANPDGLVKNEIEYCLYAKIDDFELLLKADEKRRIEQANFFTEDKGKGSLCVRSRKIVDMDVGLNTGENSVGDVAYVLTIKTPSNDAAKKSRQEIDTVGSEDMHATMMQFCGQPLTKDRYSFKTKDGLMWEVDVFLKPDGGYSHWARIELELKDPNTPLPALPFAAADWFMADNFERRDQLKEAGEIFQ